MEANDNKPIIDLKLVLEPLPHTRDNLDKAEKALYNYFGSPIMPIRWSRICDGCKSKTKIHPKATDTIFECNNCKVKFDLCIDCQITKEKHKCPEKYGCMKR